MTLSVVRSVADLRTQVSAWKQAGESVAVVPTMGALHEGHMSLVRAARERAGRIIVTLFVNPRQFNNPNDLANYPRTEAGDREALAPLGVDVLYAPDVEQVYPDGFSTTVSVSGVSEGLCGAFRPGHFDGVATVVAKLLLQTRADLAFFGEKDFQQLAVIRRLAIDLDIPVEIVGCPTVREDDGLALSSRNVRLSAHGRTIAPNLAAALFRAAERITHGEDEDIASVLKEARNTLLAAGFTEVEYLELRNSGNLEPISRVERPARLLAAAWLDNVRLIDNVPVPSP